MGFWDFLKTDTEVKRDDYYELYTKLSQLLEEHDQKVTEATDMYESYMRGSPFLFRTKIPSNEFTEKRSELNDMLLEKFELDKGKRIDLVIAKDRAYWRYEYYRELAISESEAKSNG